MFELLYWDRTLVPGCESLTSQENTGVIYSGTLAYGTYYLHETQAGGNAVDRWFTVTVGNDGVTVGNPVESEP